MEIEKSNESVKIVGGQQGKRIYICGKTGTGKTTYAVTKILSECKKHILVFDLKRDDDLIPLILKTFKNDVMYKTDNIDKAIKNLSNYRIVIYQPRFKNDSDFYANNDRALFSVFNRVRNCCIYIDEAMLLKDGVGLQSLYTQGRSLKLDVVACTQRPFVTPTVTKSQSEFFYIFKIVMNNDLKELSKMIDVTESDIKSLDKFQFIFKEL